MKRLLLSCLALLVCAVMWGQKTVTGTVTDNAGEPLIGANVVAKGTTVGTITDYNGEYELTLPEGVNTIVFSYTGYNTKEVGVSDRDVVDVTMVEGVQLTEAVVTALGVTREEKALGYSVQQVEGDDLDQARDANMINTLQGKIAGVQITGSSTLGGSSRILLRGANSITGENQPLFVVDGVPINNEDFSDYGQERAAGTNEYDYGNMAADINPDDIESISVLKGANAAALYGSRASNGVILITTKKGEKQDGIGVSVNSGISFQNVSVLPDYQNQYGGGPSPEFTTNEQGQLVPNYSYDGSWGPPLNGQDVRHWDSYFEYDEENFGQTRPWVSHPDNVKDYFETGYTANNNIALSGGSDDARFRLSYTNLYQKGVQVNSRLTRNTLSFNGGLDLSDRLSTSIGVNYVVNDVKGRPLIGYGESIMSQFNQWYQRQLDIERLRDYKTPTGQQRTWNRKSATDPDPLYWNNPFWDRYENYETDNRDRLFGNFSVTYDLMDNMDITGSIMTDLFTDRREERIAHGSVQEAYYSEDVRSVREDLYRVQMNYDESFGDISLTAMAGASHRYNKLSRNFGETQGGLNAPGWFNLQNAVAGVLNVDELEEYEVNSVFGSVNLGWNSTVFLDLTARNDWSSTLPSDNWSYFYPSASLSFVFTELMTSDVLSYGKLRASWAQVGNDTDPYQLRNVYTARSSFGANGIYSVPNDLANANLKPEQTTSLEFGIEARFLNDRIGFDLTYYDISTTDLIFDVPTSGATGYTTRFLNAGEMQNKGVEVTLNADIVRSPSFNWNIGVNFASNDNEVVELADGIESLELASLFGVTLEARPGEPYGTFYGNTYQTDDNGNRLVDGDGYYLSTNGVEPIGDVIADYTAGLINTFRYKGLSLTAVIDMQEGGTLHSYSNQWGKYSGTLEETAANNIREDGIVVDGVYAEGTMIDGEDVGGQPNESSIPAINHFTFHNGYFINSIDQYEASFIKLREVRLTYQFPQSLIDNIGLRNLRLAVVGRNLALIDSDVPHIDPEIATSTDNIQGFEGGQLPALRSIGVNLSFKF